MKKWRGLFPDNFYSVEAETEEEAERKMIALLKEDLETGEVKPIAWEENDPRST